MEKGIDQADKLVIRGRILAGDKVDYEDQSSYAGCLKPFIGKRLLPDYGCSLAQAWSSRENRASTNSSGLKGAKSSSS